MLGAINVLNGPPGRRLIRGRFLPIGLLLPPPSELPPFSRNPPGWLEVNLLSATFGCCCHQLTAWVGFTSTLSR